MQQQQTGGDYRARRTVHTRELLLSGGETENADQRSHTNLCSSELNNKCGRFVVVVVERAAE